MNDNPLVMCQILLASKALALASLDGSGSAVKALASVALHCQLCGGSSSCSASICAAGRLLAAIQRMLPAGGAIRRMLWVQLMVAAHVADSGAPRAAPHGLHREHLCAAGLSAVQAHLH